MGDDSESSISSASRFAETKRVTGRRRGGLRISTSASDGSSSELLKMLLSVNVLSNRGSAFVENQHTEIWWLRCNPLSHSLGSYLLDRRCYLVVRDSVHEHRDAEKSHRERSLVWMVVLPFACSFWRGQIQLDQYNYLG